MIIVFLNNKLISCDTIVPFLFELKKKQPDKVIELFCFNGATYETILQNTILAEAIISLGTLRLFGTKTNKLSDKIVGKVHAIINLIRLCGLVVFKNVHLIHFKALNSWPLKLIYILNRRRAFLFQPTMAGATALERQVDNIVKLRRASAKPVGSVLIGFQKNWNAFELVKGANTRKLVISATCNRHVWTEHLRQQGRVHLEKIGIPPGQQFITYILSSMGTNNFLKNPDDFPTLFDETLAILSQVCPDMPIIIKPHPVALAENLKLQEGIIKRHTNLNLIYAHMNPMLLAFQSKFFICNCYSSTFVMAKEAGVTTIEYTDPSDAVLAATDGGSMRPDMVDHFIQREPEQLRLLLNGLLNSNVECKKQTLFDLDQDDYEAALSMFTL